VNLGRALAANNNKSKSYELQKHQKEINENWSNDTVIIPLWFSHGISRVCLVTADFYKMRSGRVTGTPARDGNNHVNVTVF
jgi:hypothetical protein